MYNNLTIVCSCGDKRCEHVMVLAKRGDTLSIVSKNGPEKSASMWLQRKEAMWMAWWIIRNFWRSK